MGGRRLRTAAAVVVIVIVIPPPSSYSSYSSYSSSSPFSHIVQNPTNLESAHVIRIELQRGPRVSICYIVLSPHGRLGRHVSVPVSYHPPSGVTFNERPERVLDGIMRTTDPVVRGELLSAVM